jgi:hypothetical protein
LLTYEEALYRAYMVEGSSNPSEVLIVRKSGVVISEIPEIAKLFDGRIWIAIELEQLGDTLIERYRLFA